MTVKLSSVVLDRVVHRFTEDFDGVKGRLERVDQIRKLLDALREVVKFIGADLDPDVVSEPNADLVRALVPVAKGIKAYFRADVYGLEHMPQGRALIVGNHNAGITFMEPFVLGLEWFLKTDGKDIIHSLGHDIMVALPLVGNLLKQLGVIRAAHHTADQALEAGRKVMVFPGGNYEAFRPFRDRHKVDFGGHSGYIKVALRNNVPVVPFLSIGGHETFFVLHRGEFLAKLTGVKTFLRSDSFPIFLGLPYGIGLGPIFHLPLPAKCELELGEPIHFSDYGPDDAENRELVKELSQKVQGRLQEMMDKRAARRCLPILG